jgi:HEAT repeat protein/beta-lactamase regulating signal transducer with metallopeptidase domain
MSTDWMSLLISASLRASLVLGAAWMLTSLMGRASASTRHFLWTCAIAGAVLVPATVSIAPRWDVEIPSALVPVASMVSPATREDSALGDAVPSLSPQNAEIGTMAGPTSSRVPDVDAPAVATLVPLAFAFWALGAALVIGYAIVGAVATWWIRRSAAPIRVRWVEEAAVLAEAFEISRPIAFVESARATTPMVCGLWRPLIVMPRNAADWPEERLRLVVLHELAHIKRRDCVTQAMAQVVCALYWFNPLAWFAARRLRAERERACDDFVLAAGAKGSDYARHLLEIARAMRSGQLSPLAGAGLAMAHRSQLEGRLMAILDPGVPRSSALVTRLAAAALILVIAAPVTAIRLHTGRSLASPIDSRVTSSDAQVAPAPATDASALAVVPSASLASPSPLPSRSPLRASSVVETSDVRPSALADSLGESLAKILDTERAEPMVAEAAAQRAEADPQTVEALIGALRDADADVRQSVVHTLSRMRDPRIVDALIPLLNDSDADVRQQVVEVLGRSREPRAIAAVAKAVNDSSADVRQEVVHVLGQARNPEWIPSLMSALEDPAADVREQAAHALGQLRGPGAVAPLMNALKDSSADVREQAAHALGQIRDRRAVAALAAALKDENPDVREQSAHALGELRDPMALPALAAALRDPNADVREQAAHAIGRISEQ